MSLAQDPSPAPALITFLSDYGLRDEFVGVCHGVIAGLCPRARVIDLTHAIEPHDVRAGAFALANALPYLPAGVHLAVIDPGVGGERRALALRTAEQERLLVGPDNGLLMLAAERFGGVIEAVEVGHSPVRLEPVSETFHGRDIFAPVAAALASGAPLRALGDPLAVEELHALELPSAQLRERGLSAHAIHSDSFGNVTLDATPAQVAGALGSAGEPVRLRHRGSTHEVRLARRFADVEPGALALLTDAQGMTALAVNLGSAARRLGVERDDELLLEGT